MSRILSLRLIHAMHALTSNMLNKKRKPHFDLVLTETIHLLDYGSFDM